MDVLKQENGKNTKQMRQQVEALAIPQFDFQRMTALAVGLGWRQANPAQQSAPVPAVPEPAGAHLLHHHDPLQECPDRHPAQCHHGQ
jgi:hypothetical protein